MSFKSLFVKEDGSAVAEQPVAPKKKTAPAQPTSVGSVALASTPTLTTEKNEFTEFLDEVYKKGNFPGPDYQEFTDALKEVENEPMDEKSKFTTIFVGFKVQGVTKTRLVDTANKYVTLINQQVSEFNTNIENILQTEVAGKQAKIEEIAKENANIESQMIALTEKKSKNNEVIQKISQEVNEEVTGLTMKKSAFESAAQNFIAHIQTNLQKIKQYLPEPK